ncbi:Trehalose/maltose import ATP-binding protein MalK [uncultured archaeon]|nr:Trehalose/maltose import ATP-binding protein MalK [uncultured archaeon]
MRETIVINRLTREFEENARRFFPRKKTRIIRAVDDVSLSVKKGEIYGLLGPNGSGKTTTTKILSTLLTPTSGEVNVAGYDVLKQPQEVRKNIGVMLGQQLIYHRLSGRDNLMLYGDLYGVEDVGERIEELAGFFGLSERLDSLVETYSTGMKCRLAVVRALIHDPPVLLLDEPTLGLDPQAAVKLREQIKALSKEGKTIFLCTHYMLEAEYLCDKVGILSKGRLLFSGDTRHVVTQVPHSDVLEVRFTSQSKKTVEAALGVRSIEDCVQIEFSGAQHLTSLLRKIAESGATVTSMNVKSPTLEDVFVYFAENP